MDKKEFFANIAKINDDQEIDLEEAVKTYAQIAVLQDDFKKLKAIIEAKYLLPTKETHYDIETEKQIIYNSPATVLDIDNEGIFSYLWMRKRNIDILNNFSIKLKGIESLEDATVVKSKFVKDNGKKKAENISVKKISKTKLKELRGE